MVAQFSSRADQASQAVTNGQEHAVYEKGKPQRGYVKSTLGGHAGLHDYCYSFPSSSTSAEAKGSLRVHQRTA